jgi:hypothetical protein
LLVKILDGEATAEKERYSEQKTEENEQREVPEEAGENGSRA